MEKEQLSKFIQSSLADILAQSGLPVRAMDENTVIYGRDGLLDSMMLVELMLRLEDYCEAAGCSFSWTNDATMSEKRSIYNTIASLSDFLASLPEKK